MKYCSLWSQCEMKFAHIRVSEYFTFAKQIFHSVAISLARRANFTEKSQVEIRLGFFLGRGARTLNLCVALTFIFFMLSAGATLSRKRGVLVIDRIRNKKHQAVRLSVLLFGRGARTRTLDMQFWRLPFYQLNYTPI